MRIWGSFFPCKNRLKTLKILKNIKQIKKSMKFSGKPETGKPKPEPWWIPHNMPKPRNLSIRKNVFCGGILKDSLFWHHWAFPGSYGHENYWSLYRIQFSIDLNDQNQALYAPNKHLWAKHWFSVKFWPKK